MTCHKDFESCSHGRVPHVCILRFGSNVWVCNGKPVRPGTSANITSRYREERTFPSSCSLSKHINTKNIKLNETYLSFLPSWPDCRFFFKNTVGEVEKHVAIFVICILQKQWGPWVRRGFHGLVSYGCICHGFAILEMSSVKYSDEMQFGAAIGLKLNLTTFFIYQKRRLFAYAYAHFDWAWRTAWHVWSSDQVFHVDVNPCFFCKWTIFRHVWWCSPAWDFQYVKFY